MPSTSPSSSTERKPPFASRYSMMRARERRADPVELLELRLGRARQAERAGGERRAPPAQPRRRRASRRAPARRSAGRPRTRAARLVVVSSAFAGRAAGQPQRGRDAGPAGQAVEPGPPDRAGDVHVDAAPGGVPLAGRAAAGSSTETGGGVGLAARHERGSRPRARAARPRSRGRGACGARRTRARRYGARALQVGYGRNDVNEGGPACGGGDASRGPPRSESAPPAGQRTSKPRGLRALRH